MQKVTPTDTDSHGNGYYKDNYGNYYYGNVKNGYLTQTSSSQPNNNPNIRIPNAYQPQSSAPSMNLREPIDDMLDQAENYANKKITNFGNAVTIGAGAAAGYYAFSKPKRIIPMLKFFILSILMSIIALIYGVLQTQMEDTALTLHIIGQVGMILHIILFVIGFFIKKLGWMNAKLGVTILFLMSLGIDMLCKFVA